MSSDPEKPQDPNEKYVEESKEYRGWDLASESYRIGDRTWKLQKDCRKPVKCDVIQEQSDLIEATRVKLEKNEIDPATARKTSRDCNKKILEMTLIGFDYDKEAEEFGHKILAEVSKVMQAIFLMFGSWEEMIYKLKQGMEENKLLSKLAKAQPSG